MADVTSQVDDGALPPPPDEPPADHGASERGTARGFDRVPPHSLEAEVSVLGACLLSRNAAIEVSEFLQAEDFYRSAHRTVYEVIQELMARSEPIDPVTLLDLLAATGRLAEVGGARPSTTWWPPPRPRPTPCTTAASSATMPCCAGSSRPAPTSSSSATTPPRTRWPRSSEAETIVFGVADSGTTGEATALKDLLAESFRTSRS